MKTTLTTIAALALLLALASPAWAQTTTYASPVRIMNTPVPVNGTVTVTPQGGTMPVNGTISLSTTGNAVRLGGTPFAFNGEYWLPAGGTLYQNVEVIGQLPGDADKTVEIEAISAECYYFEGTTPSHTFLIFQIADDTFNYNFSFDRIETGFKTAGIGTPLENINFVSTSNARILARGGSPVKVRQSRKGDSPYSTPCMYHITGRIH